VLDQEIEAALDDLRRQQAHPEPAGDAGLPEDGMALCDIEWLAEGTSAFERKGLRLSPSMPVPGVEPDAWKDALSGKKDGDEVELAMVFPPDFDREALRGQPGTCKVKVDQAYAMVLPEDTELERLLGVEEGQTLQQAVRERIDEIKRDAENRRIEQHLIDELLTRHEIELPERMLTEQTRIRLNQAARELKEQGVPDEELEAKAKEREDELREVSAKGLRTLFLIQALAEKEGLLVNNDDMLGELKQIAERNQTDLAEVTEYYKKNELFDQMAIEILERKVRRFLRESAEVTQPS
jgi:trigger factor